MTKNFGYHLAETKVRARLERARQHLQIGFDHWADLSFMSTHYLGTLHLVNVADTKRTAAFSAVFKVKILLLVTLAFRLSLLVCSVSNFTTLALYLSALKFYAVMNNQLLKSSNKG